MNDACKNFVAGVQERDGTIVFRIVVRTFFVYTAYLCLGKGIRNLFFSPENIQAVGELLQCVIIKPFEEFCDCSIGSWRFVGFSLEIAFLISFAERFPVKKGRGWENTFSRVFSGGGDGLVNPHYFSNKYSAIASCFF